MTATDRRATYKGRLDEDNSFSGKSCRTLSSSFHIGHTGIQGLGPRSKATTNKHSFISSFKGLRRRPGFVRIATLTTAVTLSSTECIYPGQVPWSKSQLQRHVELTEGSLLAFPI